MTRIFVGDPRNSNLVSNVTLINPRGRPTVLHGKKPMIEVNGQKMRMIFNPATRSGVNLGQNQAGIARSYLQVDDDQAFFWTVSTLLPVGVSSARHPFCGTLINAPGPFNHQVGGGLDKKNAQISDAM